MCKVYAIGSASGPLLSVQILKCVGYMLQNNHYFLFPQIYFGSVEDASELCDNEEEVMDIDQSCVLTFDSVLPNSFHQKIGLYIDWTEEI